MRSDDQRIVVTGLGVVSCLGLGKDAFWKALLEGQSGVTPVQGIDTSMLRVHRAGQVQDFDWRPVVPGGDDLSMGRASRFAVTAGRLALEDAGLVGPDSNGLQGLAGRDVGVVVGTTNGEQPLVEDLHRKWLTGCLNGLDCSLVRHFSNSAISTNLARTFGLGGPNLMVTPACASGNVALATAADNIRRGRARLFLAGASDCLSRHFFYGFARLRAIAAEACQPFDRHRRGLIPGEGAAVLVLESLASARSRKAQIYSELLGYAAHSDAYHMTTPEPEGLGLAETIQAALNSAGLSPTDIQYVSAHGTGTKRNDFSETRALRLAFAKHADRLAVSSIKSMIGHAAGAASALEAVACNMALSQGRVPPTINYNEADPECDLDYVPNQARELPVEHCINNSSAFWGCNAVTVFGRLDEGS